MEEIEILKSIFPENLSVFGDRVEVSKITWLFSCAQISITVDAPKVNTIEVFLPENSPMVNQAERCLARSISGKHLSTIYSVQYLPPIQLECQLPAGYPETNPPNVTLRFYFSLFLHHRPAFTCSSSSVNHSVHIRHSPLAIDCFLSVPPAFCVVISLSARSCRSAT